jgi:hypothetical protein
MWTTAGTRSFEAINTSKAKDQVAPCHFWLSWQFLCSVNLGPVIPLASAEISPSRGTEEVGISTTLNTSQIGGFMNENLVLIGSLEANFHSLACNAGRSSSGLVVLNVTEYLRIDHAIRPRLTCSLTRTKV